MKMAPANAIRVNRQIPARGASSQAARPDGPELAGPAREVTPTAVIAAAASHQPDHRQARRTPLTAARRSGSQSGRADWMQPA
jgi:hypothetical protein